MAKNEEDKTPPTLEVKFLYEQGNDDFLSGSQLCQAMEVVSVDRQGRMTLLFWNLVPYAGGEFQKMPLKGQARVHTYDVKPVPSGTVQ